jgi:hypothetical protein
MYTDKNLVSPTKSKKCEQKNFNLNVTTNIHSARADIKESTMNAV